jgi:hypothetical protein
MPALLKKPEHRHAFLGQACRANHIPQLVSNYEVATLKDGDIPLIWGRCGGTRKKLSNSQLKQAWHQIAASLAPMLLLPADGAD